MKKYRIDYGFGIATLYTPYKYPDVRFCTLANTCFGIRKSIAKVEITRSEEVVMPESTEWNERLEFNWNERLEFNGDVYIWREDGSRKMIAPDWAADEDWEYAWADDVRYISGKGENDGDGM